jgi:hypothetical protein
MAKSTSSAIILENPPEMESLLRKYRSGNIPPLFGDEEDEGLFGSKGEEIINIYLTGFSKTYNIPLCLFPMSSNYLNSIQRSPEYENLSYENLRDLILSCEIFQPLGENIAKPNEECCKYCLEKHLLTLNNRRPMAYMCYTGMICFAAPIYISDKVAAILSTECRKPKEGAIWQNGLIRQDYYQPTILDPDNKSQEWQETPYSTIDKIDIWSESKRRIHECEEIFGVQPNELLNSINKKLRNNTIKEITPDDVDSVIISRLEQASEYLSDLFNQKYRLEKESVVGWIRAEMGSALSTIDGFWDKIRWCLENLAKLIGMDYALLISYDSSTIPSLRLQCYYGLPEESLPAMNYDYLTNQLDNFIGKIKNGEQVQEIDLMQRCADIEHII